MMPMEKETNYPNVIWKRAAVLLLLVVIAYLTFL